MNRRSLLIVSAIALLALGAIALVVYLSTRRVAEVVTAPREKTIDLGAVVTSVRSLNRLETASMEVMHVSTTKQSVGVIPDSISGDELTFLAVGQVIAGVDLSQVTANDVRRSGDTIIIEIPSSQILVSRIDNNKSKVMNRNTGVLRRQDVDLESRVRSRAEGSIRGEAVRKGILELADRNAAARLAELLHKAGYDSVVVREKGSVAPVQPRG